MRIRSTALAATLGAFLVASALYISNELRWINLTSTRLGADKAVVGQTIESWPICTSMGSLGEKADWAELDPDFAAGKRALVANDWNGAITTLTSAALRDTRNADIQNYLGYAYHRLRQLDPALQHYKQALTLNPRHRSAHEHLGEAYLALGNITKAEDHVAALERICLIPCEEYDDLKKAIAEYNKLVKG